MSSHTPIYDQTKKPATLKDASFTKILAEIAVLKERVAAIERMKKKE